MHDAGLLGRYPEALSGHLEDGRPHRVDYGPSWGHLGRLRGVLEASKKILGACWEPCNPRQRPKTSPGLLLGLSWGSLGALPELSWAVLEASWAGLEPS